MIIPDLPTDEEEITQTPLPPGRDQLLARRFGGILASDEYSAASVLYCGYFDSLGP